MSHESAWTASPSTMTGTLVESAKAMGDLSVSRIGVVSNSSPLCFRAILARQQYWL